MAGCRAPVVATPQPAITHLLTGGAVSITAFALAGMAATVAQLHAALLTQHLLVTQHGLLGLATAAGLGHRVTAYLQARVTQVEE
jgi:hypothetical protein